MIYIVLNRFSLACRATILNVLLRAYRLRNPRKLKNLMRINKGCTPNSPGIGDIEYVKNLVTGEMVTTTFRCSKFGIGHHQSTNIGWVCVFVYQIAIIKISY